MIVHGVGDLSEVYLRVEFDKNRQHDRRARDDDKYKPKPEDIVIHEGMLQDLRIVLFVLRDPRAHVVFLPSRFAIA